MHKFSKVMSGMYIVLSVILLVYTYYRAEIIYSGANQGIYFKYYVVSIVGIIFWTMVLFIKKNIRANIVLIVTSVVFGLYLVEASIRMLEINTSYAIDRSKIASELGVEFDTRTRSEVVADLIAIGKNAVPSVHPSHHIISKGIPRVDDNNLDSKNKIYPLSGLSKVDTVFANESGKFMIVETDRYGFTNNDALWDKDNIDWLLTGDSFTQGFAVDMENNIAGNLAKITGQNVINLGSPGNGPLIELAVLKEYANRLKAKKVLWFYYEENDLRGDLSFERKVPLLLSYLNSSFSQQLISSQSVVDSSIKVYLDGIDRRDNNKVNSYDWVRLSRIRELINFDPGRGEVQITSLFGQILSQAKSFVTSRGGEFYFIYLPEFYRYKNDKNIKHDFYRKKNEVINYVRNLNITVLDIHELFLQHGDPLAMFPLRSYGHYNKYGYSEVAKFIVENINE